MFISILHSPLWFGVHASYIVGMKVYVTDEKELIMEPSLKWAGNPNIMIGVKAFGLKATAQVLYLFCCETGRG